MLSEKERNDHDLKEMENIKKAEVYEWHGVIMF